MGIRLKKRTVYLCLFALAMAALLGHQIHVRNRAPRETRIGDITPRMNFSKVRISGVLRENARTLKSGARLYVVDDGTGMLAVFDEHPVPHANLAGGTHISVDGYLKIGAGNDRRLQAESVEFADMDATVSNEGFRLSSIGPEREGEYATVTGRVAHVWHPRDGSRSPHKIVLRDRSGSLPVVHWLSNVPDIQVGDVLRASGTILVYEGEVELKPAKANDLQVLD